MENGLDVRVLRCTGLEILWVFGLCILEQAEHPAPAVLWNLRVTVRRQQAVKFVRSPQQDVRDAHDNNVYNARPSLYELDWGAIRLLDFP